MFGPASLCINGEGKDIVGAGKQNTDNLTASLQRTFFELSLTLKVLLSLRAAYAKYLDNFDIENAQVYLSDRIVQLSVIGPDGVFKAATIEPSSGLRVDLSDRDHYRARVNADKDDLFISKPVLGRNSGRTSIQLSWRISNPDGSFGGVIVASIDQLRFAHFAAFDRLGKILTLRCSVWTELCAPREASRMANRMALSEARCYSRNCGKVQ